MAGQVVLREIRIEHVLGPAGQRVDLESALRIGGIDLEARQALAGGGLEALAPGDRPVQAQQRLGQRTHLADFAAAIGVVRPAQAVGILACDLVRIGGQHHQSG